MKHIIIGDTELDVKDYYCRTDDSGYFFRSDGKLWLYVNVTDICNGSCPFCINPCTKTGRTDFDISLFRKTLKRISPFIYGVSITGGEPMLCCESVNSVMEAVKEICESSTEIDMVTNGTNFSKIHERIQIEKLDSIHLSRHCIKDEDNNRLFGFPAESASDIAAILNALEDPAMVILNCVLQKTGISSTEDVIDYLEFASSLGIRNVCFIGMSRLNEYCETNYADPADINFTQDRGFHIWNAYRDHDFCSCSSGSYDAKNGSIRFYYRRIGENRAPYARQLVYTADNRLLAGFSGTEIRFEEE